MELLTWIIAITFFLYGIIMFMMVYDDYINDKSWWLPMLFLTICRLLLCASMFVAAGKMISFNLGG